MFLKIRSLDGFRICCTKNVVLVYGLPYQEVYIAMRQSTLEDPASQISTWFRVRTIKLL